MISTKEEKNILIIALILNIIYLLVSCGITLYGSHINSSDIVVGGLFMIMTNIMMLVAVLFACDEYKKTKLND